MKIPFIVAFTIVGLLIVVLGLQVQLNDVKARCLSLDRRVNQLEQR